MSLEGSQQGEEAREVGRASWEGSHRSHQGLCLSIHDSLNCAWEFLQTFDSNFMDAEAVVVIHNPLTANSSVQLQANQERNIKFQYRGILQNIYKTPVLLKIAIKNKRSLRTCHKQQEPNSLQEPTSISEWQLNVMCWDFLGGPVVKTLHFQCRGPRFDPWSGNRTLHATTKTQRSQVNK